MARTKAHSSASRYELRAAETAEEARLANRLMAHYSPPTARAALYWRESPTETNPFSRGQQIHLALRGDQIAGALRLQTETMRLGESRIKAGGIAWLAAAEAHHSALRDMAQYACKVLADQACHVATLFTTDAFLAPSRFVPIIQEHVLSMETLAIYTPQASLPRVRPAKPSDIGALQRLHSASDQAVDGSFIRTTAQFKARWGLWQSAKVMVCGQGQITGYYRAECRDGVLLVQEVGVQGPEAARQLIATIAADAWEASCHVMQFLAPSSHPMVGALRAHYPGALAGETSYPIGRSALLNLGELFEALEAEWEARVEAAYIPAHQIDLCLVIDKQPWRIQCHQGAIAVLPGAARHAVAMSGKAFLALVWGVDSGAAFLAQERRWLPPAQTRFFEALFPPRKPYVWVADRF